MSGINADAWISGIAFSTNPWGHARQSAVGIHWCINNCGNPAVWYSENWNNDNLAMFTNGKVFKVSVPVVPNGNSKLLYLIEHDNNWLGTMHNVVRVNGREIDRFSTAYGNNPFAVSNNSKFYDRYMATEVPADLIPADADFITVEVDMTKQDHQIHFREMGTHDYN